MARPSGDEGNSDAAFPACTFPFTKWSGAPGMIAIRKPRAIVGRVYDERIVVDLVLFEGVDDLPHGPVDFGDDIAVGALLGFALELVGSKEGDVRHWVREIEEEGSTSILVDKVDCALGETRCEVALFFRGYFFVDDFLVLDQRKVRPLFKPLSHREVSDVGMIGPHVVGVWDTEVFIESVVGREQFFRAPEMPLTVDGGGVSFLFEKIGDGGFVMVEADE